MRISDWSSDVCSSDLNACLFPLRKGKRFDLRERQIRKRFLCAVPNAIQIMPIEHHLQNIIVNDFDPAFMVIGKDRYTPFARPWDEPPCEHACPYGGENQASPKCVHELRPCNLEDRKSVVSGQSVSVRLDLGGRRILKKKK